MLLWIFNQYPQKGSLDITVNFLRSYQSFAEQYHPVILTLTSFPTLNILYIAKFDTRGEVYF